MRISRPADSLDYVLIFCAEELEALQELHMWRLTKLDPSLAEFIYDSRYIVQIPCMKFHPVLAKLSIKTVKGLKLRERDPFPQLSRLALEGAQYLATSAGDAGIRQVRLLSHLLLGSQD